MEFSKKEAGADDDICAWIYLLDISQENDLFCNGYFTAINKWRDWNSRYCIVYANDTKVKYFIAYSAKKFGITPLYNADGTLQVYDGE